MMKHLRLYPILYALLTVAILICLIHIIRMLFGLSRQHVHAGAQLVREVIGFAAV